MQGRQPRAGCSLCRSAGRRQWCHPPRPFLQPYGEWRDPSIPQVSNVPDVPHAKPCLRSLWELVRSSARKTFISCFLLTSAFYLFNRVTACCRRIRYNLHSPATVSPHSCIVESVQEIRHIYSNWTRRSLRRHSRSRLERTKIHGFFREPVDAFERQNVQKP